MGLIVGFLFGLNGTYFFLLDSIGFMCLFLGFNRNSWVLQRFLKGTGRIWMFTHILIVNQCVVMGVCVNKLRMGLIGLYRLLLMQCSGI